jgi:hypothetical protein
MNLFDAGRCALAAALLAGAVASRAAEAPPTPSDTAEALRLAAQHAHRVEVDEPASEDPVVFTDLSPYTIDETPVRLPDDQSLR